jgi:5-hydroxyisourate hydrolase-like protein (transthyretin family)
MSPSRSNIILLVGILCVLVALAVYRFASKQAWQQMPVSPESSAAASKPPPEAAPEKSALPHPSDILSQPKLQNPATLAQSTRSYVVATTEGLPRHAPMPEALSLASISGTVTEESKAPVAGADVSVLNILNDPDQLVDTVATKSDGQYSVSNLTAGLYEIRVAHPDYASACLTNITIKAGQQIRDVDVCLNAGVRLEGKVVDTRQQPVADTRLFAEKTILRMNLFGGKPVQSSYPYSSTMSGSDGHFLLARLSSGANVLRAEKQGFVAESQNITIDPQAPPAPMTIVLTPGATIGGKVVMEQNKPIQAAKVWASSHTDLHGHSHAIEQPRVVMTDSEGRFALNDVRPEGWYELMAEAAGFTTGVFLDIQPNSTDNVLVLEHGGSIEGKVTYLDTGNPAMNVQIQLQGSGAKNAQLKRAASDARGLYVFENLPSDTYSLTVVSNRLTAAEKQGVKVEPGKPVTGIDFQVYEGLTINGSVVDAITKKGVAQAKVVARAHVGNRFQTSQNLQTTADDMGYFALKNLPAGIYYLTASAEGYVSVTSFEQQYRVILDQDKPSPPVVITLYSGGSVEGYVYTPARKAIPFAMVQLFQPPATQNRINTRNLKTATDINGYFKISGINITKPLELYASAYAENFAKGKSDHILLSELQPSASVNIILKRGGSIAGRVTNSDRVPISQAQLVLNHDEFAGDRYSGNPEAWTNSDGWYKFYHIAEGLVIVKVAADGYVAQQQSLELADEEDRSDVHFTLSRGYQISGMVIDDKGSALENARVQASPQGDATGSGAATTDPTGYYAITDIGEGEFTVTATARKKTASGTQSYRLHKKDVQSGRTDVDFVFPINGAISGNVLDSSTLLPVSRFVMSADATFDEGDGATGHFAIRNKSFLGDKGEFLLSDLPDGVYRLEITADAYAKKRVEHIPVVSPSTTQAGTIMLDPGGSIQARIVSSATDLPISGAQGKLDKGWKNTATSANDGMLRFASLAPDTYVLTLRHSHYLTTYIRNIRVAKDEPTVLGDILMDPGGIVEGTVVDGEQKPLAGVTVSTNAGEEKKRSTTDAGGYYMIDGIPPGYATLTAETTVRDQNVYAVEQAYVLADESITVNFVIDASRTLRGRMFSYSLGLQDFRLQVCLIDDNNFINDAHRISATVAQDGQFIVENLVPGRYYLVAQAKVITPPPGIPKRIISTTEYVNLAASTVQKDIEFLDGEFSGTVVESKSQLPVVGATITLASTTPPYTDSSEILAALEWSAASNKDGKFLIYGLPDGTYDLYASGPGYPPKRYDTLTFGRNQKIAEYRLALAP